MKTILFKLFSIIIHYKPLIYDILEKCRALLAKTLFKQKLKK